MNKRIARQVIIVTLLFLFIVNVIFLIKHLYTKKNDVTNFHIARFQLIVDVNEAIRDSNLKIGEAFFNTINTPFTKATLSNHPTFDRTFTIDALKQSLSTHNAKEISSLTGGLHAGKVNLSIKLQDDSWINYTRNIPFVENWLNFYSSLYILTLLTILTLLYLLIFYWKLNDKFIKPLDQLIEDIKQINFNNLVTLTPVGPSVIQKTIFALNELQAEISKNKKERDVIFASISHDLKTPLTRIKMKFEQFDNLPQDGTDFIYANIEEMNEIITSLLSFIKFHYQDLDKHKVDLSSLLDSMLNDMIDLELPVTIDANNSHKMIVLGDTKMLRRAFDNLLSNSIKYGKVANVSYSIENKHAVLNFDDLGEVIKEDKINMLFSTFYRDAKHANMPGHGLGLSIVHSIIVRHGGSINVCPLPNGNRFQVLLPIL